MRDRYQKEQDLPLAERWLENYLLTRKQADSRQLLHTTRLTDLIYQGFAAQQPINRFSSDRNTPDMESLAKDLFAALYSPILRRKDEDSVKLKERMLSKPLFEKIVGSDYFNELKGLCEDKELPSYDAVSAFCNVLVRDFPAIDTPELRYLDVIEQLTMQAKKAIQAIYDSRNSQKPASAKKLLFLYNRINRKLSQIECLTAKIQKAAVRWAEALEPVIDTALRATLHEAFKTHTIMEAWGSSNEEMRNIPMNQTLLNYVKNSKQLQEIARLLGRYRELIADKRKNSYSYGRGEKYDLTTGNDITNCLSSELALLGMAETEILFMRRYEQKRLMQYRKRTAVVKGRGDMIVLIDESGSTRSVAGWAKALALALLDVASRDGRKFAMVHFASADRIRTDLFEPGHYTPEDVMKAAEQFFGGGTNFEAPLKEALRLMENGYENADITIITDGECSLSEIFTEEFHKKTAACKATVTGILLDKGGTCGKSLEPFCDKIYHSSDLTEDEIALDILNSKVS